VKICVFKGRLNKFHFNWGWGGSADGFYVITNLKPEKTNFNFSSKQQAVINIKPSTAYTITFNPNGNGSVVSLSPTSSKTRGTGKLTSLPIPSRDGFAFKGWFTAADGGTQVTINEFTRDGYVSDGKWYTSTTTVYPDNSEFPKNFENGTGGWMRITGTGFLDGGHYLGISTGTGNTYNISSPSITHIYKDITFPVSSSDFNLSFDFKGVGENNYDYMTVKYSNTSSIPTEGSRFNGTLLGSYSVSSGWSRKNITLPVADFSGKTIRLVASNHLRPLII